MNSWVSDAFPFPSFFVLLWLLLLFFLLGTKVLPEKQVMSLQPYICLYRSKQYTKDRSHPHPQTFQEEMVHFWEWLDVCRGPVSCALVALMAHGGPQGQLLGADR